MISLFDLIAWSVGGLPSIKGRQAGYRKWKWALNANDIISLSFTIKSFIEILEVPYVLCGVSVKEKCLENSVSFVNVN